MKKTTSERLKEIMYLKDLKQIDIINLCRNNPFGIKLNKSDLSQYVSGKFLPKQDKLTLLGYALNVSEAWLMGYDVPMERIELSSSTEEKNEKKLVLIDKFTSLINKFNDDKLDSFTELINLLNKCSAEQIDQINIYIKFINSQNN